MAFTIEVELLDIGEPRVWRKLLVLDNYNFDHFHHLIQRAMQWKNRHLYEFYEEGSDILRIGSPQYGEVTINAYKVEVEPVLMSIYEYNLLGFSKHRKYLYYTYDYGDNWKCRIDVLDHLENPSHHRKLMEAGGVSPPEDIGGPHMFSLIRKVKRGEASREEYDQVSHLMNDRRVKRFDENKFDLEWLRKKV